MAKPASIHFQRLNFENIFREANERGKRIDSRFINNNQSERKSFGLLLDSSFSLENSQRT